MVFDIQRYSIHDGPGIRTLVFLKGCPLCCRWCSNPESWQLGSQLFYSSSECIHCGECTKVAPKHGITINDQGRLDINFSLLNKNDLSWVKVCPAGALRIKGFSMSVDDVFETVMRDEIFYRRSGGGITLSGGEPLLQKDFAKALLLFARQECISTVVETTGQVPIETLLAVVHCVDLFLYDFKIFDGDKHLRYTGGPNNRIKENLEILVKKGSNVLVRMPLIPGINDDEENIEQTLAYLCRIGVRHFTVLPYHQYGSGKYQSIGSSYSLAAIVPPETALIEKMNNRVVDAGFLLKYQSQQ
jgi:pyruvate formate lyase activating enzyme